MIARPLGSKPKKVSVAEELALYSPPQWRIPPDGDVSPGEWPVGMQCLEPTFSVSSHGRHSRFATFQNALPTNILLLLPISKDNPLSPKRDLNLK